jgi:hypothetical protein
LVKKLIALKCKQKVLIFRKFYTPKFLGCYNDLRAIHDLYSQCLIQTLSKTTSNREPEGVCCNMQLDLAVNCSSGPSLNAIGFTLICNLH